MSEISELILLLNKQHQEQMAVLRGEHQEQMTMLPRAAKNSTKQLEQPARKCSNTDGKFSTIRFHI